MNREEEGTARGNRDGARCNQPFVVAKDLADFAGIEKALLFAWEPD